MGLNLNTTSGKVLASLALVGSAAGVAGLGTYGAFTSSTSANTTVGSGTVDIALGAVDGEPNSLNSPARSSMKVTGKFCSATSWKMWS